MLQIFSTQTVVSKMETHFVAINWGLFVIFLNIGLAPFSFNRKTGHITENVAKILWSILVLIIFSLNFCYQHKAKMFTHNWHGLMIAFSEWVVLILALATLTSSILQALLCRKTQMLLLYELNEVDFIFRKHFSTKLAEKKIMHRTLLKLAFFGGNFILKNSMVVNGQNISTILHSLHLALPIMPVMIRLLMQIFYIDSVSERLRVLNEELRICGELFDSTTQNREAHRKVIVKIQFTYTKIWKCFKKINTIFGWSSILLVLKQFVYLIVLSFWCINKPKKMGINLWEQTELALEIVTVISALFLLCHSAAGCKKEASRTAQVLLKPVEYNLENWDARDFLSQLQHQSFESTANRFFNIDYSLLGSTLAATVTYIVIMLQLEQN
ncbi:putative gustatory receptor 2a [Topomyia yanbarensis]|uniref:putative gustatory receptor 2a n=1 Tax=Topomyia yanbarensis TaxID=2498891 RepID=UPI00273CC7F2|nr:putative gustatory receptor 2a [Topomyia yanbarensis]XP_058821194.1 putative gustatory receptor 2a [Topomyia yanbarensis]